MRTAILINYDANDGQAKEKWMRIKDLVMEKMSPGTLLIPYHKNFNLHDCLEKLIKDEQTDFFISAGGDGSINCLLNNLVTICGTNLSKIYLGAIGLGSSNDFLKPTTNHIGEIAVKINTTNSVPADIGKIRYINEKGETESRFFIVNASIGIVAEANQFFNHGNRNLIFLKKRFMNLAILYAATKTILKYENNFIRIITPEKRSSMVAANISITKNPNISGKFRYDQQTEPDSGLLGLHTIGDVTHFELLKILWGLSLGRFSGKSNRSSTFVTDCKIESDQLLLFETDGEVYKGKDFQLDIIPKAIRIAR